MLKPTGGKWVTVTDDFNPQHVTLTVETMRVDFLAFVRPGDILFDDVIVKEVGDQTRAPKDVAIKPVATRPATQSRDELYPNRPKK